MGSASDFVKRYIKEAFSHFPTQATLLGIHEHDHELEDFSKDGREELLRFVKRTSRELTRFDREKLSSDGRLDLALLGSELSDYLLAFEEQKAWETDPSVYPENILYSAYALVGRHETSWTRRGSSLLSRMKRFPRFLNQGKKNLKNPPKLFTQIALEVTAGGIDFFRSWEVEKFPLPKTLKQDVEKERKKTLVALDDYLAWLKDKLLPVSHGNFAVGKSFYNRLLKERHLLPYNSEDLKAIGEEHLQRTLKELTRLAASIDRNKSWQEILADGSQSHPKPGELIPVYKALMEKAKAFIVEKNLVPLPSYEEIVITETPPFNRMVLPFAAYMPATPFGKQGRGEFWVTPVSTHLPAMELEARLREHAYHKIPLTVLHETYPGHHVQFSFLREFSSPMLKRAFSTVSCEGWAFYCEQMMKEAGFYSDPLSELSQLKDQLWRVVRVILDVGLQTNKISPRKAVEFLHEKVLFPEAMSWGEVKRYTREATQPMSYFIGKHEILRLRDNYQRKKGAKFRLFDFHQEFLQCGVTPLKLAEDRLIAL